MKKVLFLSFSYPYGHFGPSDNCTVRIMDALTRIGQYEVWNLSYKPLNDNSKPNYKVVEGVNLLYLPFSENRTHHSYAIEHLLLLLLIPLYPIYYPFSILRHRRECLKVLKNKKFDLVVSQCAPQESVFIGAIIKKRGIVDRHMVLFWDNIYGKFPLKVIPKWFALYRSRKLENWIAKHADRLVSPAPFKQFHDKYGEVECGVGKRVYLEHPSIMPPERNDTIPVERFVKENKINVLYAGKVYHKEQLAYCINLLGKTSIAERINLILLTRGLSETDLEEVIKGFKGNVVMYGWVPIDELNALYTKVNFCIAFSGYPSAVTSKVYECMCYGNPIIHFYEEEEDVTKVAISQYPLSMSVCVKKDFCDYINQIDNFIINSFDKRIDYCDVERQFPNATGAAYVKAIKEIVEGVNIQ